MYKDMLLYLLNNIENKKDYFIFTRVLCHCIINKDINISEFNEIMEKLVGWNNENSCDV